MATRWGICSCGLISSDFCTALKTLSSSEHDIVAVAARTKDSAEDFAKRFNVPAAYGSYEELARDPNVEIVYVGTINPHHYAACKLFMESGKHVLCEKPVTMTVAELKQLISIAKERKLFFMEGFWTRFFPTVRALQEELKAGTVGTVKIVRVPFCIPISHVDRAVKKALGGGGLLDIGCYTVQWANLVFKEQPEKIVAVGQLNEDGVDVWATITLIYSGGRMAILNYNIDCAFSGNTLAIHGSKEAIEISHPMHCPTKMVLHSGETKEFPLPESPHKYNFVNSVGLVYEAQAVRECLQQGLTECPQMPLQDSINILTIIEEALRQLGVQGCTQP
ncbi:trans-1,2-dihydrobenzene-1,2-diol dehydrogenase-like [Pomacea canaliculata]|uniref:trans-1,2-dihydrobenzene-1,2-diol dehydrogenase-like n=1 Tax=Pomacea canaliculata TaxID=400727 RepID=UPI000D72855B|nr:trans-1,2-dihydrobenzene-1,2-diol dehydrogenase-like [Pomacea canaliculata]